MNWLFPTSAKVIILNLIVFYEQNYIVNQTFNFLTQHLDTSIHILEFNILLGFDETKCFTDKLISKFVNFKPCTNQIPKLDSVLDLYDNPIYPIITLLKINFKFIFVELCTSVTNHLANYCIAFFDR
jgi:hypothetical protein